MKKQGFFKNAELLRCYFGIIPLMYGSLGLEYITGESLCADDVDILIPEKFITDKWDEFKGILISEGYILIDAHEHTFIKDGICFSYASIEELESFANINLSDIEQRVIDGIEFKVLSLEQYLRVYQSSVKDGYRVNVRQKKDNEKITFIEKMLRVKGVDKSRET